MIAAKSRWVAQLTGMVAVVLVFSTGHIRSAESVDLTIMTHTFEALNDWVFDRIDAYTAEHPHINIVQTHVPPADIGETFAVRAAGGVPPDIVNIHSRNFADFEIRNFLSVPPDHVVEDILDSFVPQAYEGTVINGQLYGYPTEAIVQLPIASVRMFEDLGLTYPTRFMDLLDIQDKMSQEFDGLLLRAGVRLRTSSGWFADHWFMTLRALTGNFLDPETLAPLFNIDEKGAAATEIHGRLLAPGHQQYSDRLGIRFSGSWFMSRGVTWSPGVDYEPLPALMDVEGNKTAWGYHWGMFVTNSSSNKEEAWAFVQWLNEPRNRIGLIEQAFYPPITYENIQRYLNDPWFGMFVAEYVHSEPWPNIPRLEEIRTVLRDELLPAARMEVSPVNAIESAESRVRVILEEVAAELRNR